MHTINDFLSKFFSYKMQGQIRHLLSAIGAVLVTLGVLDEQTIAAATGVIMTLLSFIASWYAPEKTTEAHDNAPK